MPPLKSFRVGMCRVEVEIPSYSLLTSTIHEETLSQTLHGSMTRFLSIPNLDLSVDDFGFLELFSYLISKCLSVFFEDSVDLLFQWLFDPNQLVLHRRLQQSRQFCRF